MNKIFHYRLDGTHDECAADNPWDQCFFNSDTDLDSFKSLPLVTIGGQPVIRQHQATYITGRDTSHAHHFAKMVAGALLAGDYPQAPSLNVETQNLASPASPVPCAATPVAAPSGNHDNKVLWIDTVHNPYACASLYKEINDSFHPAEGQFDLMCLDMLGVFREDFYDVIDRIESRIRRLKPTLIVIDDIDHFMPYCGIKVASHFFNIFRDALNHTNAAFLMIGYNHLGKRASTTGELGKLLFPSSDTIFSMTTQNGVSHLRLVRSLGWHHAIPDAEFIFSLSDDNLPRELVRTLPSGAVSPTFVEQTTLSDIITQVIDPDESITPDELVTRISRRQIHLNRIDRARTIIAHATAFGLIKKLASKNQYTLTTSDLTTPVNNPLTLPPHP